MARIFLSYAREDESQVRGVYRRLIDAGFEVWMDKINLLPGQRWQQEIPQAIRHSDFILIFLALIMASATFGHPAPPDNVTC